MSLENIYQFMSKVEDTVENIMKKNIFSRYLILIIVVGFFLFGCATAEYRMVKGECSSQAFQQYPVNNHIEVELAFRQVIVGTEQDCKPDWRRPGAMTCTTQYIYEMQPYQKQVNVDSNAGARNQAIRSCTTSLCYSRYGNAECD
tara:strand:- start:139 stop:573 length:435 start_codon:yes stop_codon:yes gene_type:complete